MYICDNPDCDNAVLVYGNRWCPACHNDYGLKQDQLMKMTKHFLDCKYEGAGSFVYSFRLEQEVKRKIIREVSQIKCCGCGFSLDYS